MTARGIARQGLARPFGAERTPLPKAGKEKNRA